MCLYAVLTTIQALTTKDLCLTFDRCLPVCLFVYLYSFINPHISTYIFLPLYHSIFSSNSGLSVCVCVCAGHGTLNVLATFNRYTVNHNRHSTWTWISVNLGACFQKNFCETKFHWWVCLCECVCVSVLDTLRRDGHEQQQRRWGWRTTIVAWMRSLRAATQHPANTQGLHRPALR